MVIVTVFDVIRACVALLLIGTIFFGAFAPPPRRPNAQAEARRLLIAASAMYGVAMLTALASYILIAGLAAASGISLFALSLWLSRSVDSGEPPSDGPGRGEPPGPGPGPAGPLDEFDWDAFERELHERVDREPVSCWASPGAHRQGSDQAEQQLVHARLA